MGQPRPSLVDISQFLTNIDERTTKFGRCGPSSGHCLADFVQHWSNWAKIRPNLAKFDRRQALPGRNRRSSCGRGLVGREVPEVEGGPEERARVRPSRSSGGNWRRAGRILSESGRWRRPGAGGGRALTAEASRSGEWERSVWTGAAMGTAKVERPSGISPASLTPESEPDRRLSRTLLEEEGPQRRPTGEASTEGELGTRTSTGGRRPGVGARSNTHPAPPGVR